MAEHIAKPLVIALAGLPGAGKTSLATWLAGSLGAHIVSRDRIRRAMFDPCEDTPAEKDASFSAALLAVDVSCRLGRSTIVDGVSFASRATIDALGEVVAQRGGDLVLFHCDCPVEIAQQRIASDRRAGAVMASDRDPALAGAVAARFEPLPAYAHRLDMTQPVVAIGARALETLADYSSRSSGGRART